MERSPWKNCADWPTPLRLFATALAAITREEEPFAEFTVLALAATRVAVAEAVMADMPIAMSLRL